MKIKISNYAKHLLARKHYPVQQQIMRGHTRNPNAAVYAMVRGEGKKH